MDFLCCQSYDIILNEVFGNGEVDFADIPCALFDKLCSTSLLPGLSLSLSRNAMRFMPKLFFDLMYRNFIEGKFELYDFADLPYELATT